MKWFKHENSLANPKLRLLKRRHGAEGYGVYFQILELIAGNIEKDNINEWGFLPKEYWDEEFLAEELSVDQDRLESILDTCVGIELLQYKDNRLFCSKIIERCDDYIERIKKSVEPKEEIVVTKSEQSTNNVGHKNKKENKEIEEEREVKEEASVSYLQNLPENIIQGFVLEREVSVNQVKEKALELFNYCQMHGKKYKNYLAFLRNAIYKDYKKRTIQQVQAPQPVEQISDEQRQKNISKVNELKSKLFTKGGETK